MSPSQIVMIQLGYTPWEKLDTGSRADIIAENNTVSFGELSNRSWKKRKLHLGGGLIRSRWYWTSNVRNTSYDENCIICQNEGEHDTVDRPHVTEGQE